MKKTQIILLVAIAVAVAVLISFMGSVTTYETVSSAKQKQGKYVQLIGKLDRSKPVEYDAIKNPNYLSFYIVDTLGNSAKVVYNNPKPTDMEKSERIVLKGSMKGEEFICKEILLKCPSKYKDNKEQLQQSVNKGNS
jgi:cytochrome c-type biogenesis protein CcmE